MLQDDPELAKSAILKRLAAHAQHYQEALGQRRISEGVHQGKLTTQVMTKRISRKCAEQAISNLLADKAIDFSSDKPNAPLIITELGLAIFARMKEGDSYAKTLQHADIRAKAQEQSLGASESIALAKLGILTAIYVRNERDHEPFAEKILTAALSKRFVHKSMFDTGTAWVEPARWGNIHSEPDRKFIPNPYHTSEPVIAEALKQLKAQKAIETQSSKHIRHNITAQGKQLMEELAAHPIEELRAERDVIQPARIALAVDTVTTALADVFGHDDPRVQLAVAKLIKASGVKGRED